MLLTTGNIFKTFELHNTRQIQQSMQESVRNAAVNLSKGMDDMASSMDVQIIQNVNSLRISNEVQSILDFH